MRRWSPLTSKVAPCTTYSECGSISLRAHCARLSTSATCRMRLRQTWNHGPVRESGSALQTAEGTTITFGHDWSSNNKSDLARRKIIGTVNRIEEELIQTAEKQHKGSASTYSNSSQGTAWQKYKDEIHLVMAKEESDLNDQQKTLRKSLIAAWEENKIAPFIHRLFIDRWLTTSGYDVQEALKKVADMRYPAEWYVEARATQRDIHLHIGPTNSGKTYNALKRLEEAESGFYAGPLRLLAHEVYSRFQAKGIPCDLVTGDDVRQSEEKEVTKYAATVEMVSTARKIEVAVIDEIQMMADTERGWAWTRAFLGSVAKEVHLCGENRVLPLVQELTASMGDNLIVHEYQRLNPLKCMHTSLDGDLSRLRRGDAVVCFSILGIHAMKKAIESKTNKRVAIVYGSLPPETRAQQAALFNDPNNDYDYLVASDAIGMGLNLSIKRVVFESVWKFNGVSREQLSIPQIKQIAGRAGRYKTARQATEGDSELDIKTRRGQSVGLVTTFTETDLPIVRAALNAEAPPITTAGILPPGDFVEDLAARLPADTPHEYILTTLAEAAAVHPRYAVCSLRDQLNKSRILESIEGLTTTERHVFTMVPFAFRREYVAGGAAFLREMALCVAKRKQVTIVDLESIPLELLQERLRPSREFLEALEFLHQCLILYMWLSYRMGTVFRAQTMAEHAKEMTEKSINAYLETYTSARTETPFQPGKGSKLSNAHKASKEADVDDNFGFSNQGLDSEGSFRQEIQPAGSKRAFKRPSGIHHVTPGRASSVNWNKVSNTIGRSSKDDNAEQLTGGASQGDHVTV